MKNSAITIIGIVICHLCFVRCPKVILQTAKGPKVFDDTPFFSFDKETFQNFEFNIANYRLNRELLFKLPFSQCNPLKNFVKAFCMVFKFSKIKQDEELRMALSNFYKTFYGKDSINSKSILTVDNYLEMLSARIEKILRNEKNCCQPILVEEDGNRIICKLNNSFKECNSGNSDRANTSIKNKGQKDIVDFFLKFNELYLQGFFGNDFLNSLDNLNNEYFKRLYDSNYNVSKEFDSELFELYSKIFINLRVDNVSLFNESEEENMNELKNLNELNLLECAHQIYKRDLKGKKSKNYTESKIKVAAKVFFNISENQNMFYFISAKDMLTVSLLKEQFGKYFGGRNLSNESIELLITCCFEVEF